MVPTRRLRNCESISLNAERACRLAGFVLFNLCRVARATLLYQALNASSTGRVHDAFHSAWSIMHDRDTVYWEVC